MDKDIKFLNLLKNFQKAYNDILDFIGEDEEDTFNTYAVENYPFERSFDDIAIDDWVNKCEEIILKEKQGKSTDKYELERVREYIRKSDKKKFVLFGEFDEDFNRLYCSDDNSGKSDIIVTKERLDRDFELVSETMEEA